MRELVAGGCDGSRSRAPLQLAAGLQTWKRPGHRCPAVPFYAADPLWTGAGYSAFWKRGCASSGRSVSSAVRRTAQTSVTPFRTRVSVY